MIKGIEYLKEQQIGIYKKQPQDHRRHLRATDPRPFGRIQSTDNSS